MIHNATTTVTLQTLPTKLYTPTSRPNMVTRPRLYKQLDAGLSGMLILVSAPAGYGKSTLLSEWTRHAGLPTAWFSLDSGDNDPVRFWSHFVAALQSIPGFHNVQLGEEVETLLAEIQSQGDEALIDILVTEISAIPNPFLLVLDDLHLVTEVEILDGLYLLLEHLPLGMSGMHLAISTRGDPPWPLARLRVRGQITEIRARDLCFSLDEAAQFFNQVMGLELPQDDLLQLDKRIEGWAAGLQMVSLAMGRGDSKGGQAEFTQFLEGFTGEHRFILDYLMEEVLTNQSPTHLDFLLKSAILERMNGSLSAAVTGNPASSDILLQLEKANMFLVSLDDNRNWYRYHHLFGDLLRKQLKARYPNLIPELHRSASLWYSRAGDGPGAVKHAVLTGDWAFAAEQIEAHILPLIQHGEIVLARGWMRALPDDVIRKSPVLCMAQAWTSVKYATSELAEDLLSQAEAALSGDPSRENTLDPEIQKWVSSQIAVLQVVLARARGDSTQHQLALALEALDRMDPSGDAAARATLFFRLGLCYLDLGSQDRADRTFILAIEFGRASGNHYAVHAASYGRMVIARLNGQLHALDEICIGILGGDGIGDESGESLVGIAMVMAGGLHYEWNLLKEAERDLIRGLELVEKVGVTELLIKGHFAFSCLKIALGGLDFTPDLVVIAEGSSPHLASFAATLQARIDLLLAQRGGYQEPGRNAKRWASKQPLKIAKQASYDWDIQAILVCGRVMCWDYQRDPNSDTRAKLRKTLYAISAQYKTLEDLGWVGILIEAEIVSALILQTLGKFDEALQALERALIFAAPQNFVHTFVDEGEMMRSLLRRIITQGTSAARIQAYARELLSAFAGESPPAGLHSVGLEKGLVDPLSERESQVLRLLNTTLSVPEIAAEIHLAPTTVRTHIQHIYSKLNVHGRIEALQRAENLGLL